MSGRTPSKQAEAFAQALRELDELLARKRALLSARIGELITIYGSLRALSKAINVDHAYLHRLRNGTKQSPSDNALKKLGLPTKPASPPTVRRGE